MKNRNVIAVLLLPLVTLGIYSLYHLVKTKEEMNSIGANIPTAWLIIIPIVNIYWMWKYCEGVGQVTNEKIAGILAFILLYFLGFIAQAIFQSEFNKIPAAGGVPAQPQQGIPGPTAPPVV